MFTGIVEEAGVLSALEKAPRSSTFTIATNLPDITLGDSVAVNGCCLTVARLYPQRRKAGHKFALGFDLLEETLSRTNLGLIPSGSLVNLERSLPLTGRLGGHFVTGHIDGLGKIISFEQRGTDIYLEIKPPFELMRYLVPKGSVAIDGISLTVAEVKKSSFAVWIIPHTYEVTSLRRRAPHHLLNLEMDILAKYVERLLTPNPAQS